MLVLLLGLKGLEMDILSIFIGTFIGTFIGIKLFFGCSGVDVEQEKLDYKNKKIYISKFKHLSEEEKRDIIPKLAKETLLTCQSVRACLFKK